MDARVENLDTFDGSVLKQTGSHIKLKKEKKIVIVPTHGNRDLPKGTIKAIEKQTGEKLL